MDLLLWLFHWVSESIYNRTGYLTPIERHKRLGILSIVITLPIIACASSLWFSQAKELGTYVFLLGMPLTIVAMLLTDGFDLANQLWEVAILDIMFILQWVIWGQLIGLAVHARTRFYDLTTERQSELTGCILLVFGVGFILGIGACCLLAQQ